MQVLMTVSKQNQDGTWLFKNKSITMHGNMNVKCVEDVLWKYKSPRPILHTRSYHFFCVCNLGIMLMHVGFSVCLSLRWHNMSASEFVVLERDKDDARFLTLFWSVLVGWRMESCEVAVQRQWSFRIIDRKAEKKGCLKTARTRM
jgi:hypothetical protein